MSPLISYMCVGLLVVSSGNGQTVSVKVGDNAVVTGNIVSNGYAFLGIPYAQSPVGQNRFAVSYHLSFGVFGDDHLSA